MTLLPSTGHVPVMLPEVLDALNVRQGGLYVDGTFGGGGYSAAILEKAPCRLIALDRDPNVLDRVTEFENAYGNRFCFLPGCFGSMERLLADRNIPLVDGIVLDIGVSSMQLDQPGRGFSFRTDGPLDMRMSQTGESAADIVNGWDEVDLANIIYQYGEERLSRRVAKAIVTRRKTEPFLRTSDLANVVRRVVPKSRDGIDPATRTFQGLRIAVNDELGELQRALESAERLLSPRGRLAVVTFHSLEDRLVKNFMREKSGQGATFFRHTPDALRVSNQQGTSAFHLVKRRAVVASDAETATNPRARSARLRVVERTSDPVFPEPVEGSVP